MPLCINVYLSYYILQLFYDFKCHTCLLTFPTCILKFKKMDFRFPLRCRYECGIFFVVKYIKDPETWNIFLSIFSILSYFTLVFSTYFHSNLLFFVIFFFASLELLSSNFCNECQLLIIPNTIYFIQFLFFRFPWSFCFWLNFWITFFVFLEVFAFD